MKKTNKRKGYSAAILHSSIIGLTFLFGKIGLKYSSSPLDILAYRFTAAFAAVLIPILFNWIKVDLNLDMIKKILPLSVFYPIAFFSFQIYGLELSQSAEAGIIQAVGPIFTMILASYFLDEKTTFKQKLSILISVFGVIYIAFKNSSAPGLHNTKGIILLLISVISLAVYTVLGRKLTKDFSSIELTYVMIIISFFAYNIAAIGKHLLSGTLISFITPLKEPTFIMSILYLGILSSLGSSFLSIYALSKLEASKMSVFVNLATVISIVAGVVFLNENIFYYHIIGSLLIIGGVVGTNIFGENG